MLFNPALKISFNVYNDFWKSFRHSFTSRKKMSLRTTSSCSPCLIRPLLMYGLILTTSRETHWNWNPHNICKPLQKENILFWYKFRGIIMAEWYMFFQWRHCNIRRNVFETWHYPSHQFLWNITENSMSLKIWNKIIFHLAIISTNHLS